VRVRVRCGTGCGSTARLWSAYLSLILRRMYIVATVDVRRADAARGLPLLAASRLAGSRGAPGGRVVC
jgi:hypothetical protein